MDQRVELVLLARRGEVSVAELARQFGVSRKTAYYWLARAASEGLAGLRDRSRAPRAHPNAVPEPVRQAVLRAKAVHPSWGPRKLQPLLGEPPAIIEHWPVASTRGGILAQAGLTVPRHRRRHAPPRTQPLMAATEPNATWCADFKGWFCTGDGARCEPLTITDAYSRLVLRCQALSGGTSGQVVRPLFEATFREYGLPLRLRTDNGPPFASVGAGGLSTLSVWWIKLGILPERIDPGRPEQNGRHERFHRTMKAETASPPAATLRAQQRRFDHFRVEFNTVRPHEALQQQPPNSCYTPSPRTYPRRLEEPSYGDEAQVRRVRTNGHIKWRGGLIYITKVLIGEPVGIFETAAGWLVRYGPIELGWLDRATEQLRRPVRRR